MQTTLILHGHFYQPPREIPDTGLIPKQHSAFPHVDWNTRINRECYAANAYSRYVTYDGRVDSIVNNYEFISYNFGPTLLHWLQQEDPETYQRIREADAASVLRNQGHGNAIAQGFNHTILPLDTEHDARTQIVWGLEDFSYHFGRDAEGIWLPEAAVNPMVIDILVDLGVKFIILSPLQAAAVEESPGVWKDSGNQQALYDIPYTIEGTHGSIAAFFYHSGLAQGISFNHYLQDADKLYARLLDIQQSDAPALLHSATDGEIFGHHEPFGDMCLAALIHKIQQNDQFTLSNYGAYLESTPPTLRAKLHKGEEAKGSSWSCSHGVSRWYKDCGCSTGGKDGWNQRWRTPLREAFMLLSAKLNDIYTKEIHVLVPHIEGQELLHLYGKVLSGRESPEHFSHSVLRDDTTAEKTARLLCLLEGQRFRMYMFTSCGWFFADISGLESTQNMRYAIEAAQLYQGYTSQDLLAILTKSLKEAKSNIESLGTGDDILKSIYPSFPRGFEAIAFYTLNRLVALPEAYSDHYGIFDLVKISSPDHSQFKIIIMDKPLQTQRSYHVFYRYDEQDGLVLHIRDLQDTVPQIAYSIETADLPERMMDTVYSWINESLSRVADNDIEQITYDIKNYTALIKQGVYEPNDSFYITNMGTCLRTLHSLFRKDLPYTMKGTSLFMENLLKFIQLKADDKIKASTAQSLSAYINSHALVLKESFSPEQSEFICKMLVIARSTGFPVDITQLQNYVFTHISHARVQGGICSQALIHIGEQTGIIVDDLKN